MRILHTSMSDLSAAELRRLYDMPPGPWVRANFVSTLDGAATGADDRTDSINTPADNTVFALQRELCDAVLIGAGTVRAERYERVEKKDGRAPILVIVSNSGDLPGTITGPSDDRGDVAFVTRTRADPKALDHARTVLGDAAVWLVGDDAVDLTAAVARVHEAGYDHVLAEGGPSLFADLLAQGLVDDVALTFVPTMVGGDSIRITDGPQIEVGFERVHLVEADGTLLGLWRRTSAG